MGKTLFRIPWKATAQQQPTRHSRMQRFFWVRSRVLEKPGQASMNSQSFSTLLECRRRHMVLDRPYGLKAKCSVLQYIQGSF